MHKRRGFCEVPPRVRSAGVRRIFRGFSGVVTLCLWPSGTSGNWHSNSLEPCTKPYSDTSWATAGQIPRIRTEAPRKATRVGFECFYREFTRSLPLQLRGPAATLLTSRDACSDSIAKLLGPCFMRYRAIIAWYVAKWGIAQMCLCETKHQGEYRVFMGECYPPWKVSRVMGYRSDSIAISRSTRPPSLGVK